MGPTRRHGTRMSWYVRAVQGRWTGPGSAPACLRLTLSPAHGGAQMSHSRPTRRVAATLRVFAALSVAALTSVAASAPANANVTEGNNVYLSVWNHSSTDVSAAYCPKGHVSIHYKFGTNPNPCSVTPFIHFMHAHGGRFDDYHANPVGVVVTAPS